MDLPLAIDRMIDCIHLPMVGLLAFNPLQILLLGAIAVLLFGKRLPEVGRTVGKGLAEFRKGIRGIQDALYDVTSAVENANPGANGNSTTTLNYHQDAEDYNEATAPKFEPPPLPNAESAEAEGPPQSIATGGNNVQNDPGG